MSISAPVPCETLPLCSLPHHLPAHTHTYGYPSSHCLPLQVRALVDMLPDIDVVEGDAFNSSPTDPKFMGPDTLQRFRNGEKLPTVRMRTPLVSGPTF